MGDRPLDQAPAADPALDALEAIIGQAWQARSYTSGALVDYEMILRGALADRITAQEAEQALSGLRGWWGTGTPSERAIMARLDRIATGGAL